MNADTRLPKGTRTVMVLTVIDAGHRYDVDLVIYTTKRGYIDPVGQRITYANSWQTVFDIIRPQPDCVVVIRAAS